MTVTLAENTALISNGAVWSEGDLDSIRLKAACLLYDKLVFVGSKNLGRGRLEYAMESENASARAIDDLVSLVDGSDDLAPKFSIYGFGDDLSEWPWDSAPKVLIDATSEVLSEAYGCDISTEGTNAYDGYKHGGYLMSDILFWERYFPQASYVGDKWSELVLKRVSTKSDNLDRDIHKWAEPTTDIFSSIKWDDVVDLRKSPYLSLFRGKFAELARSNATDDIMSAYYRALEELSRIYEPNVTADVVIAVLGNIPGLPVNPVSVGSGIAAIRKSWKNRKRFGWALFIRNARELENN